MFYWHFSQSLCKVCNTPCKPNQIISQINLDLCVKSVLLTGFMVWFAGSVADFRQWLGKMSTKHQVENLLSQELANARSKILKLKSVQKNKIPFLSDSPFIMSFEWILWLETSHVNNLLDGVWYWVPYPLGRASYPITFEIKSCLNKNNSNIF